MRIPKRYYTLWFLLIYCFLVATASASGGKHKEGSFSDIILPSINFFLFVGVLAFFLKDKLHKFWIERSKAIESKVLATRKELEEARCQLAQAKERQQNLEAEIEELSRRYADSLELELQEIRDLEAEQHERIKRDYKEKLSLYERQLSKSATTGICNEVLTLLEDKLLTDFSKANDKKLRKAQIEASSALHQ